MLECQNLYIWIQNKPQHSLYRLFAWTDFEIVKCRTCPQSLVNVPWKRYLPKTCESILVDRPTEVDWRAEVAKMLCCGEGIRKSGEPKLRRCEIAMLRKPPKYLQIQCHEDAKIRCCDDARVGQCPPSATVLNWSDVLVQKKDMAEPSSKYKSTQG